MLCLPLPQTLILYMPRTRKQDQSTPPTQKAQPYNLRKIKPIAKETMTPSRLRNIIHSRLRSQPHKLSVSRQQQAHSSFNIPILRCLLPSDKINCPICLEVLLHPTLTQCGHAFCLSCAQQSRKHKVTCPLCRTTLFHEQFRPSTVLQSLLSDKIEHQLGDQGKARYQQRLQEFQQSQSKRRVGSELKSGDLVDFWTERKWRQGRVVSTSTDRQGTRLLIETPVREALMSENKRHEVYSDSRLVAKHRTFTLEEEGGFMGRTQFRIEIFDFRDHLQQSLFLSLMEGGRRMEVSVREEEGESSLMRIAMSFQGRNNQ